MTLRTLPPRWVFLFGMVFTMLPTYGPFAAVLLLVTQRWHLERRDGLWAGAAALLALPTVVHGDALGTLAALGTVAGPWIVFRAFVALKKLGLAERQQGYVGLGLLCGFGVAIVVGLMRTIDAIDVHTALTIPSAISWESAPALFGHSVLVMGGLIALLAREHPRIASSAMVLAAIGILVSGSREAAIAWVVLAILQIVVRDADSRRPRVADVVVLAVMLVVALGLAPLLGWGRVGFLLASTTSTSSPNLLTGTEVAAGDWWDDRWVDVTAGEVTLDDRVLTAYDVRKTGEEGWLRLQQLVRLTPGTTYTLSGWVEDVNDAVPGFHGWARLPDDRRFVMTSTLRDGEWSANVTGPGTLIEAREIAHDGAWRRLAVTFAYDAEAVPVTWFVGFAPDSRPQPGAATRLAGLQLEEGAEASRYQPGPATGGLSFQVARAPIWEATLQAVLERPLFGWGVGTFEDTYLAKRPGQDRLQMVPTHPHNQLLFTAYEKGLVGLLGLGLLLVALFGLTVRYRDLGFLSVVVVVLLANTFDATLLYGGVLYPLAAIAGWRGTRRGARRSDGAEAARQGTVRATLALADVIAALAALLIARAATQGAEPFALVGASLFMLLLFPAFSWREGLFPGYGLTPAQELKKQVATAAYAGLVFASGTLLFAGDVAIPLRAALVTGLVSVVTLPMARAVTKRLLHAMRLWGRPVVILGGGEAGRRVVRSLKRTPLDGLHPIGVFDDDPALRGERLRGVRVRGALPDAHAFAARHHVRHVIVAIPSLPPERLDRLINGSGRMFRQIQFVPQLPGIPTDDVIASDLDGMLALEVRNGLFAPGNRVVKRATDLLLAGVGTLLISPLLLALWVWVRLDSPGGAFHPSERIGQDGRPFRCLKFRTMHHDAETRLARLLAEDPVLRNEYERWHKLEHDPRVTRAGRLLRRTSLDELPQLWNVIRGEMSLVGPRPYLAREIPDVGAYASILFQIKPGMTGHWQVAARSQVTFAERLVMESHYVRNWSLWWDVVLLVHTPLAVVRNRGAAK